MIRVSIVGATGYGGRELIRLLNMHPEMELVAVASTSAAGERLDSVLPAFRGLTDVVCEPFDAKTLAGKSDAVFLAVPGTKSMDMGAALYEAGARVLDMGPDFRLKSPEAFATSYKTTHTQPALLTESVYGLVSAYRAQLKDARLVAVPGCYPVSVLTPLRPLIGRVQSDVPVVVDSISGISGAGRTPSQALHYPEMNENLRAYKIAVHQHVPEMEQELSHDMTVQFTPHIAPLNRGILSTITVRPAGEVDLADVYRCYDNEPFIRVLPAGQLAEVAGVRGTNFCDISWVHDTRTGNLILVSAIDNLCGGTAGMALQCMNVMFGLDETTGLRYGGMAP